MSRMKTQTRNSLAALAKHRMAGLVVCGFVAVMVVASVLFISLGEKEDISSLSKVNDLRAKECSQLSSDQWQGFLYEYPDRFGITDKILDCLLGYAPDDLVLQASKLVRQVSQKITTDIAQQRKLDQTINEITKLIDQATELEVKARIHAQLSHLLVLYSRYESAEPHNNIAITAYINQFNNPYELSSLYQQALKIDSKVNKGQKINELIVSAKKYLGEDSDYWYRVLLGFLYKKQDSVSFEIMDETLSLVQLPTYAKKAKTKLDDRAYFEFMMTYWQLQNKAGDMMESEIAQKNVELQIEQWVKQETLPHNEAEAYLTTLLNQKQIDKAVKFLEKSYAPIALQSEQYDSLMYLYNVILNYYFDEKDFGAISSHINKMVNYVVNYEDVLEPIGVSINYSIFAKFEGDILKNKAKQYEYLTKAVDLASNANSYLNSSLYLFRIMVLFYDRGHMDEAKEYYHAAKKHAEYSKNQKLIQTINEAEKAYPF